MAASIKELILNLLVGEHNNPNTKVEVNVCTNYSECLDLFTKAQCTQDTDLVVQVNFPTKSGMDQYALGENIGFFKNKLNLVRDGMKTKYSNIEVEMDYRTYSNNLKLTFGWDPSSNERDFRDFSEIIGIATKVGFQVLDLSLEINQRIPTGNFDNDENKLTGKLTGNLKVNEMKMLNFSKEFLRDNPYAFPLPPIIGSLLMFGNIDLRMKNIEDVIDSGLIPWPQEVPRFSGFRGLKEFVLPFASQGLNSLPKEDGDMNIYALFCELYEKIYNSIQGISELKVGFKNHLVTIKFTGFELFNGYFPDINTLKNV